MKACVLTGIREMELRDVADPQTGPGEVLIAIKAVGVCGSDVHYYETGRIGDQVVKYPFRVGHECSGVVEGVGPDVRHLKVGDRVAIDPAMPCRACDQCLTGRHHTCRKLRFLGCPGQAEGCLCEWIAMPEDSCFVMPAGMSFEQGALSEPLSIGVYALNLSGAGNGGGRIGILGAGPIGLSVLLAARSRGISFVYMTDKIDERLKVAEAMGASLTCNVRSGDAWRRILNVEPLGLDVVFECCGEQEALDQAILMLKPGGKLMLVGIPRVERISFGIDYLRRREISIQNVRRQVDCVPEALDMIARRRVETGRMVTHRFPLESAQAAYDTFVSGNSGKVIFCHA